MNELLLQFRVIRRRFWLVLMCVGLSAATSYLVSVNMTKTYESRATLMVGQSLTSDNPGYDELLASQRLSETFAALATLGRTLDRVDKSLGLNLATDELRSKVTAQAPSNSTLIFVRATDSDPRQAAAIANAVSQELVATSAATYGQSADVQQFLQEQLSKLRAEILQLENQISQLDTASVLTTEQAEQRADLGSKLAQARTAFTSMSQFAATTSSAAGLLTLVDPAMPPTAASSPRIAFNVGLAMLAGGLLALLLIYVLDRNDDTIRTPDDLLPVGGLATLGLITKTTQSPRGRPTMPMFSTPRAPAAEAFRALRTNLGYAGAVAELRTIVVTSALPGEGKSTVAANLASAFAQAGKNVYLIDGDLRRPSIHRAFNLANSVGLSSILRGDGVSPSGASVSIIHGLWVIPSGPLPPNPAELLGSARMEELLQFLLQDAEIIVVDSPPLQAVTDAAILATIANGTLLVVEAGRTKKRAVRRAWEALDRVQARILGVALNRLPENSNYYYNYEDVPVPQAVDGHRSQAGWPSGPST